jgi:hypothetical protein
VLNQITPEQLGPALVAKYPKLDPARVGRAVEIVNAHNIVMQARRDEHDNQIKQSDQLWVVRAASGSGWYFVRPQERSCTCPDSAKGHVCKHRIAVFLQMRFIAEFNKMLATQHQVKPADRTQPSAHNPARCEFCGQLLTTPFACAGRQHQKVQAEQAAARAAAQIPSECAAL